jgi:hypothetical protein
MGCVFDEAEDGLIAIDKVKAKMSVSTYGSHQDSYNVILMDYVMPNMDGPTATKVIRELGYTAPIFGNYIDRYTCITNLNDLIFESIYEYACAFKVAHISIFLFLLNKLTVYLSCICNLI